MGPEGAAPRSRIPKNSGIWDEISERCRGFMDGGRGIWEFPAGNSAQRRLKSEEFRPCCPPGSPGCGWMDGWMKIPEFPNPVPAPLSRDPGHGKRIEEIPKDQENFPGSQLGCPCGAGIGILGLSPGEKIGIPSEDAKFWDRLSQNPTELRGVLGIGR